MKKSILTIIVSVISSLVLFAQAPEMFKYQTVVRNNSGDIVKNQNVALRVSIVQGNENGTAVYSETHHKATNEFGLLNLEIGDGTVNSGSFSEIDWSEGPFFVSVELDPNNGNNFVFMGTSQLLSVPFALHANTAEELNLSTAPKNGDILFFNNSKWNILNKGTEGQVLKINSGLPVWHPADLPVLPMVTTNTVTEIVQTSAVCGGLAFATGNTEIIARGVCWGTNQNPTVDNNKTTDGTGLGTFTSNLTGLTAGTTYYARAYATNSSGTTYGNQVSFKTVLTVIFPTVTTSAPINLTSSTATGGGNVTETGGAEVVARGVCWSKNQNPTIADGKSEEGTGTGVFSCPITGLEPGVTYYARAFATNSAGTGYGSQSSFITQKTIPTVVTKTPASISPMGAVSGGTITIPGGGTITDKGICWGETENPSVNDNKASYGTGSDAFNGAINMLKPNTTCYVRAYAVNEIGIAYGDQKSFTTTDAFYDGFETGFSGNTGGWGIISNNAIEGAYCLFSSINNSEASLIKTVVKSGQVSFYVKGGGSARIDFYIDDELQGSFQNTFWGLQSYPISSGQHTLKWKLATWCCGSTAAWIDFIVMPK